MKIELEIEVDNEEKELLKQIFSCKNDKELEMEFKLYCQAASEEYKDMFLGKRVFTRGADIREYRLFLLIKNVFKRIPDEKIVSRLFQTRVTESRSLIKSVLAKYQYSINSILTKSLREVIEDAEENEDGKYEINCNAKYMGEELNAILAEINGRLPSISKKSGMGSVYVIEPLSYEELKKYFEI